MMFWEAVLAIMKVQVDYAQIISSQILSNLISMAAFVVIIYIIYKSMKKLEKDSEKTSKRKGL
jgi:Na+/H+ antiporter NhaD/arsenite permease-like protein